MDFTIIAAHCDNIIGITKNNKLELPWPTIKQDLHNFREKTDNCVVIVGRKTYQTLPQLPNRIIIIVSNTIKITHNAAIIVTSFLQALLEARHYNKKIYVIGGGEIYREAINNSYCSEIDITEIQGPLKEGIPCAYFPNIPENFSLVKTTKYIAEDYILINKYYENLYDFRSSEYSYLRTLTNILGHGCYKDDRTGIGTISLFSQVLRFNLENNTLPLLTTKKMAIKSVIEELLFFLRGDIDNSKLNDKGVHIWDGNTTREFLDKNGMRHIEENSLGKAYGFQWRYWGAKYIAKDTNYKEVPEKTYDQLQMVIKQLKENPMSRRIILSAWNVADLDEMALPPCHTMYIFNVQKSHDGQQKLCCHLTQRSGDMFLGVPFNIASAAILVHIIAKCVNMIPGELVITIVDAHIYKNHIEQCKLQTSRIPYKFPTLNIKKDLETVEDIEALTYDDFVISGYKHHSIIKADMAV